MLNRPAFDKLIFEVEFSQEKTSKSLARTVERKKEKQERMIKSWKDRKFKVIRREGLSESKRNKKDWIYCFTLALDDLCSDSTSSLP